jgi:hypothetical protein
MDQNEEKQEEKEKVEKKKSELPCGREKCIFCGRC